MDGTSFEHSDSDSGESWTLLENNPAYSDGSPDFPENAAIPAEKTNAEVLSEEETDGISIISDSEPESSPCDLNNVKLPLEEHCLIQQEDTPILTSPPPNVNHKNESEGDEIDFLGDNIKYKTYVHKRNPKVGTILDIIMLGTFIITAGMALGHLWSCKNECTTQTSVNKILSNLYKLQEENAYLRNKLKEISLATSYQLGQQRKLGNDKLGTKQPRCKKIFEEPLMKNDKIYSVKCMDDIKHDLNHNLLPLPEHEEELLNDINIMKNIYEKNKNWLDDEVTKQFEEAANSNIQPEANIEIKSHGEINLERKLGPVFKSPNTAQSDLKHDETKVNSHKHINLEEQVGPIFYKNPHAETNNIKEDIKTDLGHGIKTYRQINLELQLGTDPYKKLKVTENRKHDDSSEMLTDKKITYADSLKTDQPLQKSQKSEDNDKPIKWNKEHSGKRKYKDDDILLNLSSFSEDDIKKDDRYVGPKMKHEKKKHDRQKSHKKQKRHNKYEQWEMKGGYLKDFDEFSVTSSLDNDVLINKHDKKFLNPEFEKYINKLIETDSHADNKNLPKITIKFDEQSNKIDKRTGKPEKGKKGKNKDSEWFDQRSALRAEARMKLEHELFGENTSNNAAWYFRRMQKREQCRAQKDNSTVKKFAKRKMNFKMKR